MPIDRPIPQGPPKKPRILLPTPIVAPAATLPPAAAAAPAAPAAAPAALLIALA